MCAGTGLLVPALRSESLHIRAHNEEEKVMTYRSALAESVLATSLSSLDLRFLDTQMGL